MIQNLSEDIIRCWSEIADIRAYINRSVEDDNLNIPAIEERLLAFEKITKDLSQPALRSLASMIKEKQRTASPETPDKRNELIDVFDEIRLQFLTLLIATKHSNEKEEYFALLDSILKGENTEYKPKMNRGESGLVYCEFKDSWAIILPDIEATFSCDKILEELLGLYESSPLPSSWIIDFSGVKQVPTMLIGTLIGYKIGGPSKDIFICWLKDKLLPDSLMQKVASTFNCTKVGDHWFSH